MVAMTNFAFGALKSLRSALMKVDEILLVVGRMHGIPAVLLALPEEEASDLVLFRPGIVLAKICKRLLCIGVVVVVLLARIPADRLRLGALGPGVRGILVAGIHLVAFFEPLAARGSRSQPRLRSPVQP